MLIDHKSQNMQYLLHIKLKQLNNDILKEHLDCAVRSLFVQHYEPGYKYTVTVIAIIILHVQEKIQG